MTFYTEQKSKSRVEGFFVCAITPSDESSSRGWMCIPSGVRGGECVTVGGKRKKLGKMENKVKTV